jgi:hypothetical protein
MRLDREELQSTLEQQCLLRGMDPVEARLHVPGTRVDEAWKRLLLNNDLFFRVFHAQQRLRDQQAVLALLQETTGRLE